MKLNFIEPAIKVLFEQNYNIERICTAASHIYNKDTMGFKIRFDIFVYNAAMGYPVNPIVPIECVESSFRSSEVMRFGLK